MVEVGAWIEEFAGCACWSGRGKEWLVVGMLRRTG